MVRRENSGVPIIIIIAIVLSAIFGTFTISTTMKNLDIRNIGMPGDAVKILNELLKP